MGPVVVSVGHSTNRKPAAYRGQTYRKNPDRLRGCYQQYESEAQVKMKQRIGGVQSNFIRSVEWLIEITGLLVQVT